MTDKKYLKLRTKYFKKAEKYFFNGCSLLMNYWNRKIHKLDAKYYGGKRNEKL